MIAIPYLPLDEGEAAAAREGKHQGHDDGPTRLAHDTSPECGETISDTLIKPGDESDPRHG